MTPNDFTCAQLCRKAALSGELNKASKPGLHSSREKWDFDKDVTIDVGLWSKKCEIVCQPLLILYID